VSYDALFVMMQLLHHDQRYNQSLFDPIDSVLPYCGGKLQTARTAWVVVAPSLLNAADATHT